MVLTLERSPMDLIRNSILTCLETFADDDLRLISELENIIEQEGKLAYTIIFHVLTNLDFSPDDAEQCWKQVIDHCDRLSLSLGRSVNLRTAICDYFCSINRALRNPKMIEIYLFEKTDKSSKYDHLTGLFNRNFLDEALDREVARAKRHNTYLSVLFFDLDDFKKVNDTFGHQSGDAVLQEVAKIIVREKRNEDIAARYGGEELAVILPETEKYKAMVLGERIRKGIEDMELRFDKETIKITTSGGLASFPMDASNTADLLKNADEALYRAKNSGKNIITLFSLDKRRYLRLNFDGNIEARVLGFAGLPLIKARCKNISLGGLFFESNHKLKLGSKIQINIPLTADQPVLFLGTVIRVVPCGPQEYDIGVAFLEVDKTAKDVIIQLLGTAQQ